MKPRSILFFLLLIASSFFLSSCTVKYMHGRPIESAVYEVPGVGPYERQAVYHSVAPGETVWRIAKMYGVDAETIKKINRIRDVRDIKIGTRLYIPGAEPRKHIIALYPNSVWKYIVIHHSATTAGSAAEINRAHLIRGWSGVGYHFVIDNGTAGKGDGQIEMSPRWLNQQKGAHCKAGSMNEKGIGICLVGNFSKDRVSEKQMKSLVYLVDKLRIFYNISRKNIVGHGNVQGAHTECPGKYFPWKTFWSRLGT